MAQDFNEIRSKTEAGSCVAQGVLGTCLLYGIELVIDYAEAFKCLSTAAERRASRPTFHLAYMYQQGLGIAEKPHAPDNYIVGGGFFTKFRQLPVSLV